MTKQQKIGLGVAVAAAIGAAVYVVFARKAELDAAVDDAFKVGGIMAGWVKTPLGWRPPYAPEVLEGDDADFKVNGTFGVTAGLATRPV